LEGQSLFFGAFFCFGEGFAVFVFFKGIKEGKKLLGGFPFLNGVRFNSSRGGFKKTSGPPRFFFLKFLHEFKFGILFFKPFFSFLNLLASLKGA